MRTATLWYTPCDQPPTAQQIADGLQLLGVGGGLRHYDEHPGDPPSGYVVPPEYGFAVLDLDSECQDGERREGNGLIVVVEDWDRDD